MGMTSMTEPDAVLKTDTRGRVRVPRERQRALLEEFDRSGMSGTQFAAFIGVKYPTFAFWVQARRKRTRSPEGAAAGTALRWVEAVLETPTGGAEAGVSLPVDLPGGARMIVSESRQVALAAELLRALARSTDRPGC